jgi:hypothetical protein
LQKGGDGIVISVQSELQKVRFTAIHPTRTELFFSAKQGDTHPELMLSHTIRALDPTLIRDIAVCTVLQAGCRLFSY